MWCGYALIIIKGWAVVSTESLLLDSQLFRTRKTMSNVNFIAGKGPRAMQTACLIFIIRLRRERCKTFYRLFYWFSNIMIKIHGSFLNASKLYLDCLVEFLMVIHIFLNIWQGRIYGVEYAACGNIS